MTSSILYSLNYNKVSKNPIKNNRGIKQENSELKGLKSTVKNNGIVHNA